MKAGSVIHRRALQAAAASLLLMGNAQSASAAMTAFPGADGFGRNAQGGRGGKIIYVTTLNESGAGSLRACIDATGARVCVFRVGGVIRLTKQMLIVRNPYLTIAGQTAPGGGILITHSGGPDAHTPLVVKNTHDVIIRHIRVRPDRRGEDRGSNKSWLIENSSKVVLDHVSGSWALDQNMSQYGNVTDVTVSYSIFAEGVQRHDKCALLGSDPTKPQNFSFTNNLCASNGDRNPDVNIMPGSCAQMINNVIYNAASQFAEIWESNGGTPINIVANYFKKGPNTSSHAAAIDRPTTGTTGMARIYQAENEVEGVPMMTAVVAPALVKTPVCPLPARMTAKQAYTAVLNGAGAFPRDGVDRRVITDVKNGTGAIPTEPGVLPVIASGTPYKDNDKDGMADSWEVANGLNPAVNDAWGDKNGNGWSNMDEFLDYANKRVLAGQTIAANQIDGGRTIAGLPAWMIGLFALMGIGIWAADRKAA